ncbi:hypothetical protein LTR22_009263 [Elasticomyces elasticus]|nr:hypothetical protein LTR22_009263 [Elasticomyces elasticus]KAK4922516.1 hypothetical protein LTR49_010216 [Elasticomyces elasticus]KAK5760603.1 hypothetical protein LTS12_009312 [Elasticomyces elasticus]
MSVTTKPSLFGAALLAFTGLAIAAPATHKRDVDTRFPYLGPNVPVGDFLDPTINGNGKGFVRLVQPPAVAPAQPLNSVNVISLAYVPGGMAIHYQTPFGLDCLPSINWGTQPDDLCHTQTGYTTTYDRTPPCSLAMTTMCSQFFHNVVLEWLEPSTEYFYSIPASNGTTASATMSFTTAPKAGEEFTFAFLADLGYTNAVDTQLRLTTAVENEELAFVWHGGDISYADNWYTGLLACDDSITWAVCYNGSESRLFNTPPAKFSPEYDIDLPEGEIPNQGGPYGGDASPIYETNWDIWQQWMNGVTTKIPYMVVPGNHEASCSEGDGDGDGTKNVMTPYLNGNITNGTSEESELTYYSCPASQRNFTTYQHRFRMPGQETGGVSNFWYSFDYGNAHFITLNAETDIPNPMEFNFQEEVTGDEILPAQNETTVTDSGPFGWIRGNASENKSFEQYNWLIEDLASVNRTETPWVFVSSHRPLHTSETSQDYPVTIRQAFEEVLLEYKVDAYFSGHVHWYERIYPMHNDTIVSADIIDNNTYVTGSGNSLTTIVAGMAGNSENHGTINATKVLNYTAAINQIDFGYCRLTVHNESVATWQFISAVDGSVNDTLTMMHHA